jgi:hypothetical protein
MVRTIFHITKLPVYFEPNNMLVNPSDPRQAGAPQTKKGDQQMPG